MPAEKEFKMMPGTQSGPSYMAFARNGGMALGVKFIAIKEGAALGVADTTWIGARLRSAPEGGLFAEENGKVVKLQKYADSPAEAWPEIIWQKADDYRASTVTGVFLRGSFKGSAESRATLLEALAGKKLVNQMVDYLVQVAGIENFTVSKRDLIEFLDSQLSPAIEAIKKQVEVSDKVQKEMEASVGMFGMQAAILKKVFEATKGTEPEDEGGDDE